MSLMIRTMEAKFKKELDDLEQRLRAQLHPGVRPTIREEFTTAVRNVEQFTKSLLSEESAPGSAPVPNEQTAQDAIVKARTEASEKADPDVYRYSHKFGDSQDREQDLIDAGVLRDSSDEQKNTDAPRAADEQAGQ